MQIWNHARDCVVELGTYSPQYFFLWVEVDLKANISGLVHETLYSAISEWFNHEQTMFDNHFVFCDNYVIAVVITDSVFERYQRCEMNLITKVNFVQSNLLLLVIRLIIYLLWSFSVVFHYHIFFIFTLIYIWVSMMLSHDVFHGSGDLIHVIKSCLACQWVSYRLSCVAFIMSSLSGTSVSSSLRAFHSHTEGIFENVWSS